MFGLPVRVLHRYADEEAAMVVRVASLANVVDLAGEELAIGETVTVLNDMCFFAPGSLAACPWLEADSVTRLWRDFLVSDDTRAWSRVWTLAMLVAFAQRRPEA